MQNFHELCDWISGSVHYFLPSMHDANSGRAPNPLFKMIGRAEGKCAPPPLEPPSP